jgi:pyruvate dehydrogenase E1 component alpha subunit
VSADPKVHLTSAHARRLIERMVLIRRFEEKCAELYGAGKIRGFLHLYVGEEANAVGVMEALSEEDAVVATYREHGHAIARGLPLSALMAEMFGKASGSSGGRGGSMHVFDVRHRFYGGNAIVGGGLPLAVGLALADKMSGRSRVTCCFFGEGATAEGEFHESLNLAALWRLPVLFVCENNLYAMGTALARWDAQADICRHVTSYGVPAESVDGMDVVAVEAAARRLCEAIRSGSGPQFMENRTYRFRAHSMFDAELYRNKAEVEAWKTRDPIYRFAGWCSDAGLAPGTLDDIMAEADRQVSEAVTFAEAAPWEEVESLLRHVTTPRDTVEGLPT